MKPFIVLLMLLAVPLGKELPVHERVPVITVVAQPTIITGVASFYGYECEGKLMANGRPFNPRKFTAASYDIPLGTRVRVRNLSNDRVIEVVITDRGPNHRLHRLIDLSEAGANRLGYKHQGLTLVSIEE